MINVLVIGDQWLSVWLISNVLVIGDCQFDWWLMFPQHFLLNALWTTVKRIISVMFAPLVMSWTLKTEPVTVSMISTWCLSFHYKICITFIVQQTSECGDYCNVCNIYGALLCDPGGCVTGSETQVNARYDLNTKLCQSKNFELTCTKFNFKINS